MARMILDLPQDVQMAIRLRAVKDDKKTGEVVAAAMRLAFPDDIQDVYKAEPVHVSEERIQEIVDIAVGRKPMLPIPAMEITKDELDAAVTRSGKQCHGGKYCTCCSSGCDCGCRDECPAFRARIKRHLEADEQSYRDLADSGGIVDAP